MQILEVDDLEYTDQNDQDMEQVLQELAQAQVRSEKNFRKLFQMHADTQKVLQFLVQAQAKNEERFDKLEERFDRLEERFDKLEERFDKLEQRFDKLEQRVGKLEERFGKLEERFDKLEERFDKLEQRVDNLEQKLMQEIQNLSNQITNLGGRWGIYNEQTFRTTIRRILRDVKGIKVEQGHYGGRQVDLIIRNGQHIILEITSRMHPKDIAKLYQSADDYRDKIGIDPLLMVATSYISPGLFDKIKELERPIEILSCEKRA